MKRIPKRIANNSDDSDSDESNISDEDTAEESEESSNESEGDIDESEEESSISEEDTDEDSEELSIESEEDIDESEEDDDCLESGSDNEDLSTICQSYSKSCLSGIKSFAEVITIISKSKSEIAPGARTIVRKIKPDLADMVKYFKTAKSQIELKTQTLQTLAETLFMEQEQMKIKKQKCEVLVKVCKEEQSAHKSNLRDLENQLTTLEKQMSNLEERRAQANKAGREEEKSANVKQGWANGLAFVPGVNLIASPILAAGANTSRQVAKEMFKQGSEMNRQSYELAEVKNEKSDSADKVERKIMSNEKAIVSYGKKQERLKRRLVKMRGKLDDLNSKKILVQNIMTQACLNFGSARTVEGATNTAISLGQILGPMQELLTNLKETGLRKRLEELTVPDKLEVLEDKWREIQNHGMGQLEFKDLEEWA